MSNGKLYLLGGDAVLDLVADEFVPAAGGRDADIVLLMQGGRNWQKYVPLYAEPWERRGATHYHCIVPDADGELDLDAVCPRLEQATGIYIGGGHTPTYHRLYATEPLRSLICARHRSGVPVAGLSAGALLALQTCVLDSDEAEGDAPRFLPGLGLVDDLLIGVHFTERQRLPGLLKVMARLECPIAWGIDEAACLVVEDGRASRVLGRGVHQVFMTDFASRAHQVVEWKG